MGNILQLWPTNIIYESVAPEVTDQFLTDIFAIGEEYEAQHPEAHVPVAMRKNKENVYNLLADPRPAPQLFKQILKDRMIQLARAEGFYNSDEVKFGRHRSAKQQHTSKNDRQSFSYDRSYIITQSFLKSYDVVSCKSTPWNIVNPSCFYVSHNRS